MTKKNKKKKVLKDYGTFSVSAGLWAIQPEVLAKIELAIKNHEQFRVEEDWSPEFKKLTLNTSFGAIRRIDITGVLVKNDSFFGRLFDDERGMDALQEEIVTAADDSAVSGIILEVHSPGGQLSGTQELAETIKQASEKKPIVAYTGGVMASGALWISSAANRVIAIESAEIGSVGVAYTHFDVSKMFGEAGIIPTVLTSSKYKRLGNSYETLNEKAREYLQGQLDDAHEIFTSDLMKYRPKIKSGAFNGKVFFAEDALKLGIIDEIGNFDLAIATVETLYREFQKKGENMAKMAKNDESKSNLKTEEKKTVETEEKKTVETVETDKDFSNMAVMAVADLEKLRPDLIIKSREEVESAKLNVLTSVTAEELEKFRPDLVTEIKQTSSSGSAGGELARLQAKETVKPIAVSKSGGEAKPEQFMALVNKYRETNKCGIDKALSAIIEQHPQAYEAYLDAAQKKKNAELEKRKIK